MREIKFRAWDKELNIMSYANDGLLVMFLGEDICVAYDSPAGDGVVNSYELMQYTGLIDKNGKEIYEGDIVRHFKRDKEKLLKIEISSGYGVYAQENDTTKRLIGRSNTHLCYEVVGNIYENPELLG
mgnify:CR=1 FL=1